MKIFSGAIFIVISGITFHIAANTRTQNQRREIRNFSGYSIFEKISSLHENGQLSDLVSISNSKFVSGRCFYQDSDKPLAAVLVVHAMPTEDAGPIRSPAKQYRGIMSFDVFNQLPASYYDADGMTYEDLGQVQTEPIVRHDRQTYLINQEAYIDGGRIYLTTNGSYVTALRYGKNARLMTACYFFKFHK